MLDAMQREPGIFFAFKQLRQGAIGFQAGPFVLAVELVGVQGGVEAILRHGGLADLLDRRKQRLPIRRDEILHADRAADLHRLLIIRPHALQVAMFLMGLGDQDIEVGSLQWHAMRRDAQVLAPVPPILRVIEQGQAQLLHVFVIERRRRLIGAGDHPVFLLGQIAVESPFHVPGGRIVRRPRELRLDGGDGVHALPR